MRPGTDERSTPRGTWPGIVALAGMTVLAYAPALLRGGFVWDDDFHVTHNQLLRTWDGLRAIWASPGAMLQYYPFTHTSLWLEWQVFGAAPAGYHAVNILLHAANASLLWLVLRRLALPGAWLAAALFALHPVHVESVAWITEIKNVQSACLYLLAALAYLGFALPRDGEAPRRRGYVLALVLYLGAILSKTVTCTLPASLLVCTWWKRGRIVRRDVVRLVPFLAVGAAAGTLTAWMEQSRVGALGQDWGLSPVARLLVAGRALWFYLGKLALPVGLSFVYPRWAIDTGAWWQYLFPLLALGAGVLLWAVRGRIGRGPLAAALHYALTLAPALGVVNVYPMLYSFVADHYVYLAGIGPIALLAAGLAALGRRLPAVPARAAGGALLLVLGAGVWARSRVYDGPETLWNDTIRKNPTAWMAHNNLGQLLLDQGRPREAEPHFRRALELRPQLYEALYNLGNVYAADGRWDEAAAHYERALAIEPRFAPAHNNLANVYVYQGRVVEGILHYERALEILPDYPDARRNLEAARRTAGVP